MSEQQVETAKHLRALTASQSQTSGALLEMSKQQAETVIQLNQLAREQEQMSINHTTICTHQENISKQQLGLQTTVTALLDELKKPSDGAGLKETMAELLAPLSSNLNVLLASFNTLADISKVLSAQLPPPSGPSGGT